MSQQHGTMRPRPVTRQLPDSEATMATETEECPDCGHPCIVFAYGMPVPSWEQQPDDTRPEDGFDRAELLVVEMGCVIDALPDGSYLQAYCPACDVAFGAGGETIAWQPEWGHPTDRIGAVYDSEALVEEWIGGDVADPVDDVLVIAELAAWRRDVELELAARTRALDRLISQSEFELAETVVRGALPLLDRSESPRAARDAHAALARIARERADTADALEQWRLALAAGHRADDRYVLSWVQADAAADAHRAGEHDWALQLVEAAVSELEGNRDLDVAAMACKIGAAAARALGQTELALSWALRGARNELDDQDAWEITAGTKHQVERLTREFAASAPELALQALRDWETDLQPRLLDHHVEAAAWVTELLEHLEASTEADG